MKYAALFGLVASVANMFIHYSNDPAFWGWLSSSCWCLVATIDAYTYDK